MGNTIAARQRFATAATAWPRSGRACIPVKRGSTPTRPVDPDEDHEGLIRGLRLSRTALAPDRRRRPGAGDSARPAPRRPAAGRRARGWACCAPARGSADRLAFGVLRPGASASGGVVGNAGRIAALDRQHGLVPRDVHLGVPAVGGKAASTWPISASWVTTAGWASGSSSTRSFKCRVELLAQAMQLAGPDDQPARRPWPGRDGGDRSRSPATRCSGRI